MALGNSEMADMIISALDSEIQWCQQNNGHLSDEQRDWFVNGLIQARLIAKKVKNKANEHPRNGQNRTY